MIEPLDPNFYKRLKESSFQASDKIPEVRNGYLFESKELSNYYQKFKTIYHLRYALMTEEKAFDPRLIYLGIHHIIKNRGNFLYPGTMKVEDISGKKIIIDSLESINEASIGFDFTIDNDCLDKIENCFKDTKKTRSMKFSEIVELVLPLCSNNQNSKELIRLFLGYKANLSKLFALGDDKNESNKVNFSEIDDLQEVIDNFSDYEDIIAKAKAVYDWVELINILNDEKTISKAMIKKYDKYRSDLAILKKAISSCNNQLLYDAFFKSTKSTHCILEQYAGRYLYRKDKKAKTNEYDKKDGLNRTKKGFYETIKKNLLVYYPIDKTTGKTSNYDVDYILSEIENGAFMSLLRERENGAIPQQLHNNEIIAIINNQSKFYPYLSEIKEKVSLLHTFRIPYCVGPIGKDDSPFKWAIREKEGKITPWNFNDVFNVDKASEEFIKRMVKKCTYLKDQDVLPKCSLTYSYFEVLNEVNKIRINGKMAFKDYKTKMEFIDNCFKKKTKVTKKDLINFFACKNIDVKKVEGLSKENEFSSSLKANNDFSKIGIIDDFLACEELINWITIFKDKSILKKKIKEKYSKYADSTIEKICNLKYDGWGRLSNELLREIKSVDSNGEFLSIMDVLEKTNLNFMQIINYDEYEFKTIIADAQTSEPIEAFDYDTHVKNLYVSPKFKKVIYRTLQMAEEYVRLLGYAPKNIFIETAKSDEDSRQTESRYKMLDNLFKKIEENGEDKLLVKNVKSELKFYENAKFSERLFLYFLQCGKSAYSDTVLDINKLDLYEVDHILPQSLIMDDSLDNKVLVLRNENQDKADRKSIDGDIIKRMRSFWNKLHDLKLMSDKKYNNLTRSEFSEEDIDNFINRQLVGTRQITKEVINLLKERFPDSRVIGLKSRFAHDFRLKYKLFKSREMNDFHHAHDALINAVIGQYILKKYPAVIGQNDDGNENKKPFYRVYSQMLKNSNKHKYGFVVSFMGNDELFNESLMIPKIKRYMGYKDLIVTKDRFVANGEFYNQNLRKKGDSDKLLQINKRKTDTSKYGGYTTANNSYMVVICSDVKRKNVLKKEYRLVSIPIVITALQKSNPNAIMDYLKKDYTNPVIIKNNIKINQEVMSNGYNYYLTSGNEWNNAVQLVMSPNAYRLISYLEYTRSSKMDLNEDFFEIKSEQLPQLIYEFLEEFIIKIDKHYPVLNSTNIRNFIESQDYDNLKIEKKINFVMSLLHSTRANALVSNLKDYKMSSFFGRLNNKKLNINNSWFIDYSVTGLLCNKTKVDMD